MACHLSGRPSHGIPSPGPNQEPPRRANGRNAGGQEDILPFVSPGGVRNTASRAPPLAGVVSRLRGLYSPQDTAIEKRLRKAESWRRRQDEYPQSARV